MLMVLNKQTKPTALFESVGNTVQEIVAFRMANRLQVLG